MADTVIAATLKVDASSLPAASKSIVDLKKSVADLQKQFESAKVGSEEQAEAYKNLKAAQDDLKKSTDNLNKTNAETTGHFKNIKEGLGNVNPALSGATEGVGKLGTAFKALLANPIVLFITLIVAGLALLYKAFTNTFEGAEKVEQIFAGVKAAAQALFDDLSKIGSAIVKFFSFDFSGAAAEIKGIVDDVGHAYDAMSKLTKQAQDLHKEQLQNDLEQAERQKKLAVLREEATDETIPVAKRKAALLELKAAAEKNAKEDVDLAKRTAENKIAQYTLEKDGALKNQDEINKARIAAVQVETDNANELRRIDKQLTAANKAEEADRKEAAKAAADAAKARRQELIEFTNKLTKLQQENELLTIKDGYDKELKQLNNKIADEKRANQLAFNDRKITKQQQSELNSQLDIQLGLQEAAITEKHKKDIAEKEAAFQKELAAIRGKTSIDGIIDVREKERVQLNIGYEEKLQDAIKRYKDDQIKLQAIKNALADQLKADQAKLDAKNLKEDEKKGFEKSEAANKAIIDKQNFDFDAKKAALDAQTQLVQDAFDQQFISEQDYNAKTAALSEARKTIRDQEAAHNQQVASSIAGALSVLSDIAGKQTAVGKALAIASTTISTYQAAIGAFKGMVTTIPGPVGIALGVVAAAGALATGIAAVKKIVATKIPGQGGGGGAAPSGIPAAAAPVSPQQQGTKLDATSISAINNPANGGVNRPFKAYVVEQDSAEAANRAARLKSASQLGGG